MSNHDATSAHTNTNWLSACIEQTHRSRIMFARAQNDNQVTSVHKYCVQSVVPKKSVWHGAHFVRRWLHQRHQEGSRETQRYVTIVVTIVRLGWRQRWASELSLHWMIIDDDGDGWEEIWVMRALLWFSSMRAPSSLLSDAAMPILVGYYEMLSSMSSVNGHTGAAGRSLQICMISASGAACVLDLRIGTVCWMLIIPKICIASRLDYVSQMS